MTSSLPSGCRSIAIAVAGLATADAFALPSTSGAMQGSNVAGGDGIAVCGSEKADVGMATAALGSSPSARFGGAAAVLGACAAAALASSSARSGGGRPAACRSATVRMAFNPAKEVGAVEPLGFFDPLGFVKEDDVEGFRILRMAELKHGRVAMMASIGLVAQHFLKLPGAQDIPAGLGAMGTTVGQVGFLAIFAWSGVMERTWADDPSKEPGNFGDPLGVGMYDAGMRNKEINNGRFAMIAVTGILVAELATGKDAIQQFGL
mmetsp:Transcript_17743/g.55935  ORF Transcript_17743/g.55935 Transcript_17743/m.55935 type:complete len:263 (+) Transcript_17743:63-851(+)|eukprot:CAMPEP_0204579156 /NCGR_PEP_ID=MMETSP0661-20131031/43333_1 /ASSEMBLY_ACC=CAM_ASM_000606 /TAXON_ID=109239 /ORGANISM="Alexandrium margalefi, Strain AMGDE01CS-322" /LENGTH=262 /DNA_ID=CAMNT_0051588141 /DNA_START=61 /DNA_END=849 /DNA_ORIENTATION=-